MLSHAADALGQATAPAGFPRVPSLGMAFFDLALYLLPALGLGAWRVRRDP